MIPFIIKSIGPPSVTFTEGTQMDHRSRDRCSGIAVIHFSYAFYYNSVETVLFINIYCFTQCVVGTINGLDFDWIKGNVYGGTSTGNVFVCRIISEPSFTCVFILRDRGSVQDIALNPNAG